MTPQPPAAGGWTAGPWQCDGAVLDFEGACFGEVAYVLSKDGEQFPASRANARLIAAAPELVEALEAAKPWIGGLANENDSVGPVYRQLVAALHKARGQ